MNRSFKYLVDEYTIAGARDIFEKICCNLANTLYGEAYQVGVKQGDGGIDIFVGDINSETMVFQCKFFIDGIGDSQKGQIRESFKTCLNTLGQSLSTWILCVPVELTLEEHKWLSKWSEEKQANHGMKIVLWDENIIISELKKFNLYDEYFDTVRVDKAFAINIINSDKKSKVNEDFKWIINYICNNDFLYNAGDALDEIYRLGDIYGADTFFFNSSLINLLISLSNIVEMSARDGVIKSDDVKSQIYTLRQEIVNEYSSLMI